MPCAITPASRTVCSPSYVTERPPDKAAKGLHDARWLAQLPGDSLPDADLPCDRGHGRSGAQRSGHALVAEAPAAAPVFLPPPHAKREWQFFFIGVMLASTSPAVLAGAQPLLHSPRVIGRRCACRPAHLDPF